MGFEGASLMAFKGWRYLEISSVMHLVPLSFCFSTTDYCNLSNVKGLKDLSSSNFFLYYSIVPSCLSLLKSPFMFSSSPSRNLSINILEKEFNPINCLPSI